MSNNKENAAPVITCKYPDNSMPFTRSPLKEVVQVGFLPIMLDRYDHEEPVHAVGKDGFVISGEFAQKASFRTVSKPNPVTPLYLYGTDAEIAFMAVPPTEEDDICVTNRTLT